MKLSRCLRLRTSPARARALVVFLLAACTGLCARAVGEVLPNFALGRPVLVEGSRGGALVDGRFVDNHTPNSQAEQVLMPGGAAVVMFERRSTIGGIVAQTAAAGDFVVEYQPTQAGGWVTVGSIDAVESERKLGEKARSRTPVRRVSRLTIKPAVTGVGVRIRAIGSPGIEHAVAELQALGYAEAPRFAAATSNVLTNYIGDEVLLTRAVEGSEPMTLQWYRNGQPVGESSSASGTVAPALKLTKAQANQEGSYTLRASNPYGQVESPAITLVLKSRVVPGTIRWAVKVGNYLDAEPAVSEDGTIYVQSLGFPLMALDPRNGAYKWAKYGATFAGSPMVLKNGSVTVASSVGINNSLLAVEPASGQDLWAVGVTVNMIGGVPRQIPCALAADGNIYLLHDHLDLAKIKLISPDGQQLKTFDLDAAVFARGWGYAGGHLYGLQLVVMPGDELLAVGRREFFGVSTDLTKLLFGTFGTLDYSALSVNFTRGASLSPSGSIQVATRVMIGGPTLSVNHANGSLNFMVDLGSYTPPVTSQGGVMFLGSPDGIHYAFKGDFKKDPKQLLWSYKTGGPVSGSSAITDDGIVYFASYDRKLYACSATDGSLIWSRDTGRPLGGSVMIAPDGLVLVRSTDGQLIAVEGTVGPAKGGWPLLFHDPQNRNAMYSNGSAAETSTPTVSIISSSSSVPLGGRLELNAATTGSAPLHFQWTKDGIPLTDGGRVQGAKESRLLVWEFAAEDVGDYTVKVTNPKGEAVSSPVALTVRRYQPGERLWRSSPARGRAVSNGRTVFFGDRNVIKAVVTTTGEELWSYFTGLQSSVASDAGILPLCLSPDGILFAQVYNTTPFGLSLSARALDAKTGRLLWASENETDSTLASFNSVMTAANGKMFYSSYEKVVAWDAAQGRKLWTVVPKGLFNTGSHGPISCDSSRVYGSVSGQSSRAFALNQEGGAQLWSVGMPTGSPFAPAIGSDGLLVYVCTYSPDISGTQKSTTTILGIDAASGHILFSTPFNLPFNRSTSSANRASASPPLLSKDSIIFGGMDSMARALDRKTGKLRWETTTPGLPLASPVLTSDGLVYFATTQGTMVGLDASTGQERIRWQTDSTDAITPGLGGLLITTSLEGHISVFQATAPLAQTDWPAYMRDAGATGFTPNPLPGPPLEFQPGRLRLDQGETRLRVWWNGGRLESSQTISGPWMPEPSVLSGDVVTPSGPSRFYRVH